jgi:hypothetical protein
MTNKRRGTTPAVVTDDELNQLHQVLALGLTKLRLESEVGEGGRARILFYGLAAYLNNEGILEHLSEAANYMAQHGGGSGPNVLPLPGKQ